VVGVAGRREIGPAAAKKHAVASRRPDRPHRVFRLEQRLADGGIASAALAEDHRPTTLYLVVPPSDISRTKPLICLVLNQIGRRLTEELHPKNRRHRVLLMLDEFPALGRLDFLESALAFMAGYGLKAFLIAQSLNQIEKAYGAGSFFTLGGHVGPFS
jgi:hypothetical protein